MSSLYIREDLTDEQLVARAKALWRNYHQRWSKESLDLFADWAELNGVRSRRAAACVTPPASSRATPRRSRTPTT